MLPNIATVFAINRYAFCLANPIAVLLASGSMFPNLSYYYNGEYLTWWEQWGWTIFLGVGIIATIIACVFSGPCGGVATAATVAATLKAIALGSIVGTATALLIGGTIAGIQSALTGHGFWQAFTEYAEENFVEELIISFAFTSVATAASSLIKCFQCFKEGTLVETEDGLKPIEEIEVGDMVLA